jgi:hypothetical protein
MDDVSDLSLLSATSALEQAAEGWESFAWLKLA